MDHPTTRVLALLELLQAHHRLTGSELADRLGVDERTVRRYATRLIDLGIPVQAERGRYGGYTLRPGYKLPPLMFTDDEAAAVVLGLTAARSVGLTTGSTATATETASAKLFRVLPVELRARVEAVQDTLGLTASARVGGPPETGTVLRLAVAAHQHRRVRISYTSWRNEHRERELDPYGLVVHGGRWYASGHDHHRDEVRTFRLDRVGSVELTDAGFEPPDDFDPVTHVIRSLANVPYAYEVEVVLHTTLDEARRRIPPSVGTLVESDGSVRFSTRAERLDGMAAMLAGLGWSFDVVRPDELRAAVRELAERLLDDVRR